MPESGDLQSRVELPPGIAERAMYWSNTSIFRPAAAGSIGWSTALQSPKGAGQPTTTWEVPGCVTNYNFESWILVMADPANTQPASIKILYLTSGGSLITGPTDSLPPRTRKSYNVMDTSSTYGQAPLGAVVSSANGMQILVEHSTYFSNKQITGEDTSYRNATMDTICTNATMAP